MADCTILNYETPRLTGSQRGFVLYKGVASFNSTDASSTLQMYGLQSYIDSIKLQLLDAPQSLVEMAQIPIGSLADGGSTGRLIRCPHAGTVTEVAFTTKDATAADNNNHWTFRCTNKGAAGAGSTAIIIADSSNSTDADATPAGFSLAAYTPKALFLSLTAADLVVAAGDVLELTYTEAGTGPTMTECLSTIKFNIGGTDEMLYSGDTWSGGKLTIPTNRKITISRTGNTKTSALKFAFEIMGR